MMSSALKNPLRFFVADFGIGMKYGLAKIFIFSWTIAMIGDSVGGNPRGWTITSCLQSNFFFFFLLKGGFLSFLCLICLGSLLQPMVLKVAFSCWSLPLNSKLGPCRLWAVVESITVPDLAANIPHKPCSRWSLDLSLITPTWLRETYLWTYEDVLIFPCDTLH